jgi:ribosome biogenesis GTP-binding protein YlqF
METINWYPGHMKKTRELIRDNLKLVDLVVEVIDARIPVSSRNPIIDELIGNKPRIIALNKSDLADPKENEKWASHFNNKETRALAMNCMSGSGINGLFEALEKEQERILAEKRKLTEENQTDNAVAATGDGAIRATRRNKPLRMMIVGVPNVGKSSLINRMTGKKSTQTGDRPGVTKGKQWLTLKNGMQLLDTPGILWPKFEDPDVGLNLAFCGSIKDEILDIADLGLALIKVLQEKYPQLLTERYNLEQVSEAPLDTMESIALKRGFILPGKRIDYDRCARTVIDEFRAGKLGKITLERF